ncbi:facilitated trehalose transporter Tret1-like [Sitodiplosis mosellana]|uniref:facilitated trehalose transporter Tret1-like n=1 Tax=Sitodiplosis mosellana TaxID=263140 RepID=UPI002444280E|nr:facilitated trehalose transporter Tret1-like [Sitodiplosis mosellana]
MMNYTNKIFAEAGSTLTESTSSIIVAFVMMIANFLAMVLVDRAGRKLLMTASAFATSLSLISMGLYDSFKQSLTEHRWIPIAAFSMIILFSSIGMLPLTFVILSELIPKKIKNIIILLALECLWGLAFALVSFFPILTATFGTSMCMFFLATCCMLGALFYLMVLPETKGKTYEEIIQALAK